MQKQLRISGRDYSALKDHLFPGDENEAIAFALCGSSKRGRANQLLVHEVFLLPHHMCKRKPDLIEWPGEYLDEILEKALKRKLNVLKIHSHPGGYPAFSWVDDDCDEKLFRSINGWLDFGGFNASAIMLPDGRIFGRFIDEHGVFSAIDRVVISGDQIYVWEISDDVQLHERDLRNSQTFGPRTVQLLKKLRVGVVGCSGTGSIVVEQLVRSGIGNLVLIDPDRVELKNLNRILNSTKADALNNKLKVEVFKERIGEFGFDTDVAISSSNICDDRSALKLLATCDVIFGCTDNVESRHFLNQLSTFYLISYFDLGVKIIADKNGGISKIAGAVHYIQPKGGSLLSKGVYSIELLEAESIRRRDPQRYIQLTSEKYIKNAGIIDSPAVISVNMQIAATAFNEFLNRLHHYKSADLSSSSAIRILISDDYVETDSDTDSDKFLSKFAGLGDQEPFIGLIGI
jgi:hypothetical protein